MLLAWDFLLGHVQCGGGKDLSIAMMWEGEREGLRDWSWLSGALSELEKNLGAPDLSLR